MTLIDSIRRADRRRTVVHPRAPGETALYILRDAKGNAKIGITADRPVRRLRELQAQVEHDRRPVRLHRAYMLHCRVAGLAEREAHRRLSEHRLEWEWFRLSARECEPVVLQCIDAIIDGKRHTWVAPEGHAPVPGKRGPKGVKFTPEQMEQARAAWHDASLKTWVDVRAALPRGFSTYRAFKLWGGRQSK
ncbi:MAG: GIY-YIG nuclease family protein [Usitatibacteraceae bacterium]